VGCPPEVPVTGERKNVKILGAIELWRAAPEPERAVTGGVSGVPQPHDAGEKIETEP